MANDAGRPDWAVEMLAEQRAQRAVAEAVADKVDGINARLDAINGRVRANEVNIAGLKTWVAIVGGLGGAGVLIGAALAMLK